MPDLGKSVYTLYTDNKPFEAGMAKAESTAATSTKSIGSKIGSIGSKMRSVGKDLTHHLTLPIVAVGAVAVDMGIKFQDSMQKLNSLVGISQKQVNAWSQQFLELGPKVGQSPKALADSMFYITSAGLRGSAALQVLTQSAKASAAGLGDQKTIADAATSAMNAYGQKILSGKDAIDAMTSAVKAGKMDPATLASSLGTIIAPAQAVGMGFKDVVGNMAALSRVGISAQKSATGIRAVLTTMIKPTAGSSAELKHLGLNVDMVTKSIKNEGLLTALQGITQRAGLTKTSLKQLSADAKDGHIQWNKYKGSTGEAVKALAKVFPNVKALTTVLSLTGKNAKENAKAIDAVAHSTGATDKAFKSFETTAKGKMDHALNETKASMTSLGIKIMPIVAQAAQFLAAKIGALVSWFQRLSPFWQKVIGYGVLFLAVLGPLISILGTIATAVGFLAEGFIGLATGELAAVAPIALIVAAVALVVIGLVILYRKWGLFRTVVNAAFNGVKAVIMGVVHFIENHWRAAWNAVHNAFNTVINFIKNHWKGLMVFFLGPLGIAIDLIVGYWPKISNAAQVVFDFIKGHWQTLVNIFVPLLLPVINTVKGLWDNMVGPAKTAFGAIRDAVGWVVGKIQDLINWIGRIHWPSPPSWMGSIGGVLNKLAGGTDYAQGGMTLVGEKGPELVNMPRGAQVYTAQETKRMFAHGSPISGGGQSGTPTPVVTRLRILDWATGMAEMETMMVDLMDSRDDWRR